MPRRAGALAALLVPAAALMAAAAPAMAANQRFERIAGVKSAGTPAKYDKVGVLEFGSAKARNVLILNPGTSASAAYFAPLARTIVAREKGWQVWAVERRENLLEDHSMADRVKAGKASGKDLFDYYLGWTTDDSVKQHFQPIPDADVTFGRKWGMKTAIGDLRRVVQLAKKRGARRVVVGGHSLGGTITTAYATWDFGGKPGARGLAGLVFIDGGSRLDPITASAARKALQDLQKGSPWLQFGGIPAPYAGLFGLVAAGLVEVEPNAPSRLGDWPLLPDNLKAPVRVTNVGGYGYALDTATSPAGLVAAQAHLGRLADSGDPRGWDPAGELTPIKRFADMFFGLGLKGLDGTAWYHPQRLSLDGGAVANGKRNAAQKVLDVRTTHGADLPRNLRIYAFGASLGGTRILGAARALAKQSRIPSSRVTLVDRHTTYAHNDPNSAAPNNAFVAKLLPFLRKVARG
jgi:pimeloyl-ACP methyl ester carboxylesterase